MIPASFDYSAPETLAEALQLLSDEDTKVLAGGQSLIPMLKLRLAQPTRLVDLDRIPDLNFIAEDNGTIRIGAMTTHHQVESSALLAQKCPLLAKTAARIGDVQVRNRGTIGGSIVHADPAADYPAALLALEAKVKLTSASGDRVVALDEFLVDALTTSIEDGEILTEVQVPAEQAGVATAYRTLIQPASGFRHRWCGCTAGRNERQRLVRPRRADRRGLEALPRGRRRAGAGRSAAERADIRQGGWSRRRGRGCVDGSARLGRLSGEPSGRRGAAGSRGYRRLGMKLKGNRSLSAPRQQVWDALLDPEVLARTLPGCKSLNTVGPDEYRMNMALAISSVKGLFDGKVRIEDQQPPESYHLSVEGRGKIGFINGGGSFRLIETGAATTEIEYEGDIKIGGTIASVGQRLMDMTSKMMIKRFFAALEKELTNAT